MNTEKEEIRFMRHLLKELAAELTLTAELLRKTEERNHQLEEMLKDAEK